MLDTVPSDPCDEATANVHTYIHSTQVRWYVMQETVQPLPTGLVLDGQQG